MDAAGYTTLTRQAGLMREMQVVANNIANISTNGFRREGMIFSEYIVATDDGPSLSMANGTARHVDLGQAGLSQTGGSFDFGIQGDGFFLVETPQGQQLTRSGSFTPNDAGELVTNDGHRLLDQGGCPGVCAARCGTGGRWCGWHGIGKRRAAGENRAVATGGSAAIAASVGHHVRLPQRG